MQESGFTVSNTVKVSMKFFTQNFNSLVKNIFPTLLLVYLGLLIALGPANAVDTNGIQNAGQVVFVLVAAIIGLVIFCYAFWKFVVLSYQLILVFDNWRQTGKYDFDAFKSVVRKRAGDFAQMLIYTCLLFIVVGIIVFAFTMVLTNVVGMLPAMLLACAFMVLATLGICIYIQVFAYEKDVRPIMVPIRSIKLFYSRANLNTIGAVIMLGVISIVVSFAVFIPCFAIMLLFMKHPLILNLIDQIPSLLTTFFTLPFTTAIFTLIYKDLVSRE